MSQLEPRDVMVCAFYVRITAGTKSLFLWC